MASESKRMNALRGVMNKTVDSYLSKLVLLKSLKNVDNKQFKPLHDDIINQLENNIKTEFEHIYKEENIEQLLYGIDQMVAKDSTANKDIDAWRPSGDPYKDTLSEMAALKKEKLKVLLNNLSQLEAQNKLLQENVKKRETHLLKTRDKIVSITENMQEIVDTEKSLVSTDQ